MPDYLIDEIFQKSPKELTVEDIKTFFETEREETAVLEFKSGQVEVEDLFKEIAAFLNTEGGLIIVGAPKETKVTKVKRGVKLCQGELTYSTIRSADWLYQKIATNISPMPTDIFIKEICGDEGTVYLIEVPQSKRPPHQANADGRYYLRFDCEARPAPHGLVQALFDKRRKPVLDAELIILKKNGNVVNVQVSFVNNSNVPADKVGILISVYNAQKVVSEANIREWNDDSGSHFSISETSHQVLASVITWPIRFSIMNKASNFLISAAFWSLESDYDHKFWTINPFNGEIVNKGDLNNSQLDLKEAIKLLEN
ncbi:MAG: ATP-binding protein [Imperialibacter sp.]|uniref:AlbA family DNA-binding domain-containing protein n=1 Tax=Imperialibacter sp. TaxID=2038411 RepID=UPI0032EAD616